MNRTDDVLNLLEARADEMRSALTELRRLLAERAQAETAFEEERGPDDA